MLVDCSEETFECTAVELRLGRLPGPSTCLHIPGPGRRAAFAYSGKLVAARAAKNATRILLVCGALAVQRQGGG